MRGSRVEESEGNWGGNEGNGGNGELGDGGNWTVREG